MSDMWQEKGSKQMANSNYRESPFLTGHHRPNRMEVDAPDLFVEGELPGDLAGVFYRNGAEPLYPPTDEDYHWFDGDGMVYAFFIEDGQVSMRNRWVRTDKLLLEMKEKRRLFGVFGNPATTDPVARGTRYNTANTNIILHGGKLLALMEGAPPVELDPRSLDTIGEEHHGGVITTAFSAHPTVDHATGELINFGVLAREQGRAPEIRYDVIDFDGQPIKTETIPVPHQSLMHTFFVTENYVVFPVTPLDISIERALSGGPMTAWVPDRPSKLGVMPRNGSAADVRWFEAEPRAHDASGQRVGRQWPDHRRCRRGRGHRVIPRHPRQSPLPQGNSAEPAPLDDRPHRRHRRGARRDPQRPGHPIPAPRRPAHDTPEQIHIL
jgi:carotenoid cleavage dioxygenase-like enzyme